MVRRDVPALGLRWKEHELAMLPDMDALAEQLVGAAAGQDTALTGESGLLTALTRKVLQSALEAEMSHHLGYDSTTRWVVISAILATEPRLRR